MTTPGKTIIARVATRERVTVKHFSTEDCVLRGYEKEFTGRADVVDGIEQVAWGLRIIVKNVGTILVPWSGLKCANEVPIAEPETPAKKEKP